MKAHLKIITDKKIWEKFLLSITPISLFQSFNFGESEKKQGVIVYRLGFYQQSKLQGIAQIFQIKSKRGNFLHLRGGPVFKDYTKFKLFFPQLKRFAREKKADFLRISPPILVSDTKSSKVINKLGFKDVPIPLLDAEIAWMLNLKPSEEELLKQMRKTTRYLIKKAMRMRITVTKSREISACQDLLKLYQKMTREKGIVPHQGILQEFIQFKKDDQALIFRAYYQNKLMGAALIIFYQDEAIYHHSAHIKDNQIPASYLIQWEAIKEAKKRNKKKYNFFGIEPEGNPKHPWYGLSLFKKGFGGKMRQFIQAKDYPLTLFYYKTYLIETIRRIRRYKSL